MTPSACRTALAAVPLLLACSSGGPSAEERREFTALERSLRALSAAPLEDRPIRLEELDAVSIRSPRVRKIKTLCTAAYRSFGTASEKLDVARTRTREVEAEVRRAQAREADGGVMTPAQQTALAGLSSSATSALDGADRALDEAEELVRSCEERRDAFRATLR